MITKSYDLTPSECAVIKEALAFYIQRTNGDKMFLWMLATRLPIDLAPDLHSAIGEPTDEDDNIPIALTNRRLTDDDIDNGWH